MHDFGRLSQLRNAAVDFELDVDIAWAVRPSSPMGTERAYFVVAEKGVLLYEPRYIGNNFDDACSALRNMGATERCNRLDNGYPYYGG
jgi:hypothetical protein